MEGRRYSAVNYTRDTMLPVFRTFNEMVELQNVTKYETLSTFIWRLELTRVPSDNCKQGCVGEGVVGNSTSKNYKYSFFFCSLTFST